MNKCIEVSGHLYQKMTTYFFAESINHFLICISAIKAFAIKAWRKAKFSNILSCKGTIHFLFEWQCGKCENLLLAFV
ncbi:peroxiredoxin [Geomicrobium halophilum]|uniref:Peroxiredoxin n=1 Tax=Geomicrobium halophilum TaxID=549000 RepID=A0A841PVY3_9BACL|nr:peroxiredoxin [Geomicrobium halophilum]